MFVAGVKRPPREADHHLFLRLGMSEAKLTLPFQPLWHAQDIFTVTLHYHLTIASSRCIKNHTSGRF